MTSAKEARRICRRLLRIRNQFDQEASVEKLALLKQLQSARIQTASDLQQLHSTLCYVVAFPDTLEHHRKALNLLRGFAERIARLPESQRVALDESGIVGSRLHYAFSFDVATWLAKQAPGSVSISWADMPDTTVLDELLTQLLEPSEDEYFDSGYVSSKEWIDTASSDRKGTDFDWLMAQLRDARHRRFWSRLYDAAEIMLAWDLHGAPFSKTLNAAIPIAVQTRQDGMRRRMPQVKKEIGRPVVSIKKLSRQAGARLVDVAMASLAVRHRETYHFNHANPAEVYLADVGAGVSIAVFGLLPEFRFPLETTMGYLILSNGMPIGYGGSSALFRQINTGINIFDEYRDSEASYLWVQVMRVYHHLIGSTRFIANAYQFGGDNDEALASGAFWFYYRLGYRPVLPAICKLALREYGRIRRDRKYRSNLATLRKLGSCDMHLTLPGERASDLFDEQWLESVSMLVTREIAAADGKTRQSAVDRVAENVALKLDITAHSRWSTEEKLAFRRLAPIISAAYDSSWNVGDKRTLKALARAKGNAAELDYARLLVRHAQFRKALLAKCRRAEL